MKTHLFMLTFSLCILNSFANASTEIIGNCSEEIASEYSKLEKKHKDIVKVQFGTDKLDGRQSIIELDSQDRLVGMISVRAEMFECKLTLHKDGKEIAKKEVDVCRSCSSYSTDMAVLFNEGEKGKRDQLLSKYDSNKLVIFGVLNGGASEAEIGIHRHNEFRKRLRVDINDEKTILVKPIKISKERVESVSFENYDLEIQCAPVEKMVRHI